MVKRGSNVGRIDRRAWLASTLAGRSNPTEPESEPANLRTCNWCHRESPRFVTGKRPNSARAAVADAVKACDSLGGDPHATSSRFVAAGALTLSLLTLPPPAVDAGPPAICHQFQTGGAPSLPWAEGSGWRRTVAAYDLQRLDRRHPAAADADHTGAGADGDHPPRDDLRVHRRAASPANCCRASSDARSTASPAAQPIARRCSTRATWSSRTGRPT